MKNFIIFLLFLQNAILYSATAQIIDGMDDRVDISSVELNIKVTKNHENEWELFVDSQIDNSFESEGTWKDNDLIAAQFFGIYCHFSSTRSDKFYFDNLSINGEVYTDDVSPKSIHCSFCQIQASS